MNQRNMDILKNSTILLVEDNIELRQNFKKILSFYIDNIYEVSNGKEALEIYENNDIDIVFSDIKMPFIDGLELTKYIRSINENIPIVIISAFAQQNILLEFMRLHLVEYLIKPIEYDNLLNVLDRCAKILDDKSLVNFKLSNNLLYNKLTKSIVKDDLVIKLSKKEIMLLELFIKNNGKLVSKQMIDDEVYLNKVMTVPALKNLVFKLRKKLYYDVISNVSSCGYILTCK